MAESLRTLIIFLVLSNIFIVSTFAQSHYNQPIARDSYAEAAADFSQSGSNGHQHGSNAQYNAPSSSYTPGGSEGGQTMKFHYSMYPSDSSGVSSSYGTPSSSYGSPSSSYGVQSDEEEDGGLGGSGGAGLLGLLGLLGLKGLKALKIPKLFALLPILLPILLPLLLPILLIGLFVILFIPIPVITIPGGRSLDLGIGAFRELSMDQSCVERISCEVTRVARNYGFNPLWAQKILSSPNFKSSWTEKISQGAARASEGECKKYLCDPVSTIRRAFKIHSIPSNQIKS